MAKKNQIDMGDYIPTDEEYKAYLWCVRNGIKISPKAKSSILWQIVIDIKGTINVSPDSFKKVEIWKKIYEYNKYYYKKYGKNVS